MTLGLDLRVPLVLDSELHGERNSRQYPKIARALSGMDHYSILDPGFPPQSRMPNSAPMGVGFDVASAQGMAGMEALDVRVAVEPQNGLESSIMRLPREDYSRSMAELAESDLDAMLQLLAERAEYITNATGAAIALREGEEMVCRASAGSSAPVLGARLHVDSGLSGESVRTHQTLRCDDAETDARVNRESCRSLGIASVVVMPLVREHEVGGLFELFSDQPYAFSERDLDTLERLGEMVHTALQHAEAAVANPGVLQVEAEPIFEKQVQATALDVPAVQPGVTVENPRLGKPEPTQIFHPESEPAKPAAEVSQLDSVPVIKSPAPTAAVEPVAPAQKVVPGATTGPDSRKEPGLAQAAVVETPRRGVLVSELANIGKCETCGFPVSEGRRLCLDCEGRLPKMDSAGTNSIAKKAQSVPLSPQFLSGGMDESGEEGLGISYNRYFTTVLVVIALLVIAFLLSHRS